jgi:hypothetical protein
MTINEKFKSAIFRGTGEAHLILMKHPELNLSAEIIKAAKKNLAYDSQSEGSRADYIYELINLSKQKRKIRDKIITALLKESEDTWALDQLFDIVKLFAIEGDEEAKKAIYKRYSMKFLDYSDWVGEDAILELDGLKGLMEIAKRKGKLFIEDKNAYEDSFVVDEFQKANPEIRVMKELKKAAKNNNYIESYVKMISKNKFKQFSGTRKKYSYEIVTEKIRTNQIVPLPPARAKDLSEKDVLRLADDFKKAKTRIIQEKYLRVFDRVKYPYNFNDLLLHAKRPYSSKDRLVEFAVNSLRHFKNSEIRKFALERLSKNVKNPTDYTNLLIANYKNGDGELLTRLVNKTNNIHKIHDLAWSFVQIYEVNETKDCLEPLVALYGKLNCGMHREDLVKILISNNVLPLNINNEIKFDSYLDTRDLAK